MRFLKGFLIGLVVLVAVYALGPKAKIPTLSTSVPELKLSAQSLDSFITHREEQNPLIKEDNEARIIWADSTHQITEYSIVYLHGFSASQAEGEPLHRELAQRYGCNLYLPRLAGHGLAEEEPMLNLTASQMIASAAEAIAVGKKLGKKVILLCTSTGGSLALYLGAHQPEIAGFILYSPNIKIYDASATLLDKPWGLQLAQLVKGSNYHSWPLDSLRAQYWTNRYRLEVLTQLQGMVRQTMRPATFVQIEQPVFLGYYYKDEEHQDNTVSVEAILDMFEQLGTPDSLKRKVAFPEAGHHVIGSYLTSQDLPNVRNATFQFVEEVLGLQPVDSLAY
ncbi:alpha/beta fold hydrolase [Cytophagales bacterium LB-30]|uniref:Alpha/beta fold hydrolase n=1 Tax=Shiella aurantiaca TaxID=3058365 RepID=A0ABT8F1R0_9BACT|nr:alpha/beta fold hydrolase [Shiella aurantiaca]MDN4164318.1 alpha/beta fold hydrolase [Shiella aurantiaca]